METSTIARALFDLVRQGIGNRTLFEGVAEGLHFKGLSRLDIMDFFWRFLGDFPLSDSEEDNVSDFFQDLRGNCPPRGIIQLPGDPEDPDERAEKVLLEVRSWKPPSE